MDGGKRWLGEETDNVSQSVFVNCANVAALIARELFGDVCPSPTRKVQSCESEGVEKGGERRTIDRWIDP